MTKESFTFSWYFGNKSDQKGLLSWNNLYVWIHIQNNNYIFKWKCVVISIKGRRVTKWRHRSSYFTISLPIIPSLRQPLEGERWWSFRPTWIHCPWPAGRPHAAADALTAPTPPSTLHFGELSTDKVRYMCSEVEKFSKFGTLWYNQTPATVLPHVFQPAVTVVLNPSILNTHGSWQGPVTSWS